MAFASRWTDELKRAVIAAQLDHGYNPQQASGAAHAGQLPGIGQGVPAAPIGAPYCRDLAAAERRRRKQLEKAREAPGEIVASAVARLAAILDDAVTREERKARGGRVDPARIVGLARAGQEVAKLARAAQGPGAKQPNPSTGAPDEPDFIGGLAGTA